ncbi:TARBP2, partial [Cordylochernes scorpioides]
MLPIPPHKTPISMLQELCARHDLTPDYKMVSVEGQVHQPTFIFRVAVGESSATASGQSKKKAKHAAARRVLEQLLQPGGVFENQELLEELRSLEEPEPTPAPPPPVPQMEAHVGSVVKSKPKLEDAAENNPVGTLQELCMKRRWRPPYYETVCEEGLPHERTFDIACYVNEFKETGKPLTAVTVYKGWCIVVTEKHYCLVQLTNYPTVVCFGSGHTEDLAKADAAYSALQYLQVLSKNIPKPK